MAKTTSKAEGNVKLPKYSRIGSKVTGSLPTSIKTPPPPKK